MFNPSYRLSLEARYYFEIGEYDKAIKLAHQAYILDPYNRMAFTLETQAKIAKEWVQFLKDAKEYFSKIEQIASKEKITKKDKIRVKMMLEILIDEYKTLKPSILLPKSIKEEAKKNYLSAKELYDEIFKNRSG
jgi:tetratricopeptide (TPR) repeat protein